MTDNVKNLRSRLAVKLDLFNVPNRKTLFLLYSKDTVSKAVWPWALFANHKTTGRVMIGRVFRLTAVPPDEITVKNLRFMSFRVEDRAVQCDVQWIDGLMPLPVPAKNHLDNLLIDLGKWERLTTSVYQLKLGSTDKPQANFGHELYEIITGVTEPSLNTPQRRGHVIFRLKEAESLLRTNGRENIGPPEIDEIKNQIGNLPKWTNFIKLIANLRETGPTEI